MKRLITPLLLFLSVAVFSPVCSYAQIKGDVRATVKASVTDDRVKLAYNADAFISTWKTDNAGTSNDDQITLPLQIGGTYNFTATWGDGTSDIITAYNQAEVTHTYPSAGTYTVRIAGTINGWRFNAAGDCLKIIDISQWGNLLVGNNERYFLGCTQMTITATDKLNLSSTQTFYAFFNGCAKIETLSMVKAEDVGNVISIKYMLNNCDGLSSTDFGIIKNWDVTSLTDATGFMIYCTNSLSTADYDDVLVNWEAQAVQNNVTIHFNNSTYTLGSVAAAARQRLIDDHLWTITDGGGI